MSSFNQAIPDSRTTPKIAQNYDENRSATKPDNTKAYKRGPARRPLIQSSSTDRLLKPASASTDAAISNTIASGSSSQATTASSGLQETPKSQLPRAAADCGSSVARRNPSFPDEYPVNHDPNIIKKRNAQKRVRDTETEGIRHDGQQPQKKPRAGSDPLVNSLHSGSVAEPAPEKQFVLLRSQKGALGVSTFGHIFNPNVLLFKVLLPDDKNKKIGRERNYLEFIAREIEECVRKCNMEQLTNEGKAKDRQIEKEKAEEERLQVELGPRG
jgi:hypothetical protein